MSKRARDAGRQPEQPIVTPDGRYLVVRGRLWRRANPALPVQERERLVHDLMKARRDVAAARKAGDREVLAAARRHVDDAKRGLGERGPLWWTDGAPDLNRHLARTTPYADWFAQRDGSGSGAQGEDGTPLAPAGPR